MLNSHAKNEIPGFSWAIAWAKVDQNHKHNAMWKITQTFRSLHYFSSSQDHRSDNLLSYLRNSSYVLNTIMNIYLSSVALQNTNYHWDKITNLTISSVIKSYVLKTIKNMYTNLTILTKATFWIRCTSARWFFKTPLVTSAVWLFKTSCVTESSSQIWQSSQ